jgi:hypothetical protein
MLPLSLLRRRLGLAAALLGSKRQIVSHVLMQKATAFDAPDPTEQLVQAILRFGGDEGISPPPPEPSSVLRRQP